MVIKFKILILFSLVLVYPFLLHSNMNNWDIRLQFTSFENLKEIDSPYEATDDSNELIDLSLQSNNISIGILFKIFSI